MAVKRGPANTKFFTEVSHRRPVETLLCEQDSCSSDYIGSISSGHWTLTSRARTTSIGFRHSGHQCTDLQAVGPTSLRFSIDLAPHTGHCVRPDRGVIAIVYSFAKICLASGLIRSGVHTGARQNRTTTSCPSFRAATLTSFSMVLNAGHPKMVGTRSTRIDEASMTTSSKIPSCLIVRSGYSGSVTNPTADLTVARSNCVMVTRTPLTKSRVLFGPNQRFAKRSARQRFFGHYQALRFASFSLKVPNRSH